MKELVRLLNDMREAGVIGNYALFGAVAQMRYAEPVATQALAAKHELANAWKRFEERFFNE